MLNYIVADFYRIFRKKSFYLFLAVCSLGFIALNFIMSGNNYTSEIYTILTGTLLNLVPIFVGVYSFGAVYTDDLRSKSLQTAIGFGKKRSEIILVKLIDATLLMLIFTLLILVHVHVVPMVMGLKLEAGHVLGLNTAVLISFLKSIGFFALSSVAVFFFQKATTATTLYVLLSAGVFHMMFSIFLTQSFVINAIGNLQPYLLTEVIGSISMYIQNGTGDIVLNLMIMGGYILVATVAAIIVFNHKELEF
ncbi:hypothetical protein G7059_09730 [Erysipelothrix sp. HDW6A]|uniref:hypothetical protein n=1 Tax=Erysipelothrix sp. HDW6A TaxID=2714928 RepID=UPI001408002F|nr:hypothetical protein [Erysipelothrix sp. HDW6A]QIK58102.1 hypothetical protein G7059_09730 [Erysipelothrix sp. HDW6A]